MEVRLGPGASDEGPNYARQVKSTPPALRETTARELLAFPYSSGQVGSPLTMDADASSGFLRMARQRPQVAMHVRE